MRIDPNRFITPATMLYKAWVRSLRYYDNGESERHVIANQTKGQPLVCTLWHSEIFSLVGWGWLHNNHAATIVSKSHDGEIIARVLQQLNYATCRGSNSRAGAQALLGCKRLMERENKLGVFPCDGPRGPRYEPKDGPIFTAFKANAKIVPMRAYPRRFYRFHSWDRFELPYPFTRVKIRIGEPYSLEIDELNNENLFFERERLKKSMLELI